ncbi:SRPBCC domain-containing protein [Flagellimonas halotolerans]|uniref:SRPBCC domain-containing protein n=1 Tax=Flagellimonas halotolerans TaxID=3112164 RepID=A0ABU6IRH3_9FLAO|nr:MULTISPECIES: SRPBCC domain-containing protein [unclassified Allomuricauda]MEC3965831.1 SRPBCC domain-containing protein [Muricauda sp. SYSU M86414]MEC4265703.1 SRPBCC domain-containing protein [Muricauda sp. SYSU M84420]
MKNSLLFNFSVDKENKTINIKREFNAELELVWRAWTTPEILDQWWAPKPYHIETKRLNLEVGGMWLYAMVSPKNEKTWCKADYKTITTNKLLSWLDAFCDENGNENTVKPRSLWTNHFSEKNEVTLVDITLKHDRLEDIETLLEMGFKEGFTSGLKNLDEYLQIQKNRSNT